MSRRPARTRVASSALTAAALAALLGACGDAEPLRTPAPAPATTAPATSVPGTTPATSPGGGTATISRFDVESSISCVGKTTASVPVAYATTGAVAVAFLVDGEQLDGAPSLSGSFELPIPCDDATHTVIIAALDHNGGTTYRSVDIATSTTPAGD